MSENYVWSAFKKKSHAQGHPNELHTPFKMIGIPTAFSVRRTPGWARG